MHALLGQKLGQTQKFLENGQRIPVTRVKVDGNVVVSVRTPDKHGYMAVQLGLGSRKTGNRAILGHIKGAKLTLAPQFLREVPLADGEQVPEVGTVVKASEVFVVGDIVDVTGTSKGKGYAGVVKRHHFKGGPRTHGQSDRERAPGSIGQTTTPGRVYRGKRMAGRMGVDTSTVSNLQVIGVTDTEIWLKGLVPGYTTNFIIIEKVGEDKKFTPLHASFAPATPIDEAPEEVKEPEALEEMKEEPAVVAEEPKEEAPPIAVENATEIKEEENASK